MKPQSDTICSVKSFFKISTVMLCVMLSIGCEDRKTVPNEKVTPSPVEVPPKETVRASIEKIEFQLPECKETHCPQIQIYRFISNKPELNALIDAYTIKYIQNVVKTFDANNLQGDLEVVPIKGETPINNIARAEKTEKNDVISSSDEIKNLDFINMLQPSINSFVYLSEEIGALGARSQLNLYIKPQLIKVDDSLVTVSVDASNYMGGAHGSTSQEYINFDLNHKRYLNLEEVIQRDAFGEFNKIVYQKFKTWISEVDQTLDVQTYESLWPFKVSENFYLDKNHLVLQYGQYELGPYAVGLPRLEIPYEELTNIIKVQYLPKSYHEMEAQKQLVSKATHE